MQKYQLNSFDFVINRFFMKLFKTSNIRIVQLCQELFHFELPVEAVAPDSWISRRGGYEAARHRADTESPRLLQCCARGTSSVDPSTTAKSTECRCSSRL